MMRLAKVIFGFFIMNTLVGASQDSASQDDKAIQGKWKVISGEQSGKKFSHEELREAVLIFKDGLITAKVGDKTVSVNKYKLSSATNPKAIDVEGIDGATEGLTQLGIYELKGDELSLSFGLDKRPKKQLDRTEEVKGQMLIKLQRVQ
jgi:uncharacterized protein (TIGR03067 family)